MNGEIGQFALTLALCMALIQGVIPLVGTAVKKDAWLAVAAPAARAQALFLFVAYVCLSFAFVNHDFSLAYVAQNSNTQLPLFYLLSAVWGGHEGSILLWAVVLAGWTVAVTWLSGTLPTQIRAHVIAVMGLVSVGLLAFMLGTSSPFERLIPAAVEGKDLNPLLQDPGMIIHPPLLYMGYVGLAVPYAFAVAALIDGRVDAAWTRWTRPWTITAWLFLTLGIAIGSWWAYSELGWGGWWFWDPVENASFMPWLLATALIHSLAVTELRGAFRAWTVLLAIFGFSLSLLGTFLVRSGVLVSVHAFASDPERGTFILVFLVLVTGGALMLFAMRGARLSASTESAIFSRETLLLINNVLLVVASASVLVGTLYPLVLDALALGKISVGPPYFNRVFVPLMILLAITLGVGPAVRWKTDRIARLAPRLRAVAMASVVLAIVAVAVAAPLWSWSAAGALSLGLWILFTTALGIRDRLGSNGAGVRWRRLRPAFLGMSLAHIGFAIALIGITATSTWSVGKDLRMSPGVTYEVHGRQFLFVGVERHEGPNYTAARGEFHLLRGSDDPIVLFPEKRIYGSSGQAMTEAAVHIGAMQDIYLALGDAREQGAWAVRVQFKPLVRWIWLGPIIMALGGLLVVLDRRYRLRVHLDTAAHSTVSPANAVASRSA